jgi:hypothetical protein
VLLFGTIFNLLHQEIHLGGEHVHLIDGVHTSLLWQEALFIPSLVDHHLLMRSVASFTLCWRNAPPAAASR